MERPVDLAREQVEGLTVAMIVAPGVYARNRMFDFFTTSGARRARARAAMVRGIVVQLARATEVTLAASGAGASAGYTLRYLIAELRLTRVVELSLAELAALRLVADRGRVRALPSEAGDKDVVARALARLLEGQMLPEVLRRSRDDLLASCGPGEGPGGFGDCHAPRPPEGRPG